MPVHARALVLAALCALPAHGAITDAQVTAGISVVVLDDAGTPVPGARVLLTGLSDSVHRVIEADATGQAVFESLPEGSFSLGAEMDGFTRGSFGSPPIPIAVVQGTQFRATVVIQRFGGIAGTVTDDQSLPVAAEVRLLRHQSGSGGRRLQLVATTRSSSSGAFSFTTVVPGEYFVCGRATNRTGGATAMAVPTCASNVRVSPAGLAGNVSLFIAQQPAGRLEGKIVDSNGQPATATQIHIAPAVDDGFGITSLRTGASGEFAATLLPGTYNLVVRGAGSIEATLSAGITTEVLFPLGRGVSVSGQITAGGDAGKPSLPVGTTVFELVPSVSSFAHLMSSIPIRLTEAGSLAFGASSIPPGDYQLTLPGALGDWLPSSARSGDRDLLTDGLRIFGTDQIADVIVELVPADAELAGRVVGADDAPLFDRRVLVFPSERRLWTSAAGRIRWAQPDTSGRFEIKGLPAGSFLLALIDGTHTDDWTPAFLEAVTPDALPVSIEKGKRLVQTIRVTR